MKYISPQKEFWQGRSDSLKNERIFQVIQSLDRIHKEIINADKTNFAFVGFACDEGIKRNLGRVGAKEGPNAIRKILANFSTHGLERCDFYDAGNITCDDENLEQAQLALGEIVANLLDQKLFPIVLGGGHEVAFGHYLGIEKNNPEMNLGIINFDAHFDLRPLISDKEGSSGSPFLQIAHKRKEKLLSFNYLCLGIQPQANTHSLFETANNLGVNYIYADRMLDVIYVNKVIDEFLQKCDQIYLSLCLDAFAQAYAPGVSAPQALGLIPTHILQFLERIIFSQKVITFDVAELSPPFDIQDVTAKLAANLIYFIIYKIAAMRIST